MRLVDGFGAAQGAVENKVTRLRPQSDFPGCRDLEAYWDALRGTRIVPKRTDFDPRGIERTLTCTFVAERVAASVVRIRVAGSQLSDILGMDVRGMPITAFFDPEGRDQLAQTCRRLFDMPEKAVLELQAPGRLGRPALQARLVLLPMSDGQGQITRVVGCLEPAAQSGRVARRFSITHVQMTALSGTSPQSERHSAPAYPVRPAPEPAPAFAERAPRLFRSRRVAPGQPVKAASVPQLPKPGAHLRVVVDNS